MKIKMVKKMPTEVELCVGGQALRDMCGCSTPSECVGEEADTEAYVTQLCGYAVRAGRRTVAFDCNALAENREDLLYIRNTVVCGILDALRENAQAPLRQGTVYVVSDYRSDGEAFRRFRLTQPGGKQIERQFFGDADDPIGGRFADSERQYADERKFCEFLAQLIAARQYTKYATVYKRSGISKSTFSKIMNFQKPHKPSKETVGCLCIGLRLDIDEAQALYHAAGYHLGTSEFVDRVIRFFIGEKRYDINEVNACLEQYKHPLIGEQLRRSEDGVEVE